MCQQALQPAKINHPCCTAAVCRVSCQAGQPNVVVTREAGKNGKLVKALSQHNISCVEVPLIEHAAGPDRYVLE